jgi:hypothetical protein
MTLGVFKMGSFAAGVILLRSSEKQKIDSQTIILDPLFSMRRRIGWAVIDSLPTTFRTDAPRTGFAISSWPKGVASQQLSSSLLPIGS